MSNESSAEASRSAHRVLLDLPRSLWSETARAARRALGRLPREELPSGLRPFAEWKPERLLAERPRRALASALAEDPRLRDALRDELGGTVNGTDVSRLIDAVGEERATACLIAEGRWNELATLASQVSDRQAARAEAAAEEAGARELADLRAERDRLATQLAEQRQERVRLQDELQAVRQAAEATAAERDAARGEAEGARERLERLEQDRRAEQARARDREQRLRRRAEHAEARAGADTDQLLRISWQLEELAAQVREAVPMGPSRADSTDHGHSARRSAGQAPAHPEEDRVGGEEQSRQAARRESVLPRAVPAAEPGRPCRMPPGVQRDTPDGVAALLQVPGLTLLLDGYNLAKDSVGRPSAKLGEQRQWLVQVAAGVTARHRCKAIVVFDGTDPVPGAAPAVRGVHVVFSEGDELADERIIALLDGLRDDAPACLVTSDREVRRQAQARGADVVASATFLSAVA